MTRSMPSSLTSTEGRLCAPSGRARNCRRWLSQPFRQRRRRSAHASRTILPSSATTRPRVSARRSAFPPSGPSALLNMRRWWPHIGNRRQEMPRHVIKRWRSLLLAALFCLEAACAARRGTVHAALTAAAERNDALAVSDALEALIAAGQDTLADREYAYEVVRTHE